ncbi:MAG TPA: hypothetical protein VGC90_03510 [Candidatus Limnocylindrales bacterium]
MRRLLSLVQAAVMAFALVAAASIVSAPAASAATLARTTVCSNGVDNTGGLGLICEVTIVNRITAVGGSAKVTVRECHGAAGDPAASCVVTTRNLTRPVTVVTQCNDSINGGGGTLRCKVTVTNNFIGISRAATAATVNQCVGSGGGITTGCDPFPATTSGATITQCNGSANGGTLVGLTCTATGTKSANAAVRINQCNGSANGGGALVICSASITNNQLAAPTPTPSPTSTSGGSTGVTPPETSTIAASDDATGAPLPVGGIVLVVAIGALAAIRIRASRTASR